MDIFEGTEQIQQLVISRAISGSHLDWMRLEQQRAALRARWADWSSSWDVLLCPVTPTPALPHDHEGDFFTRTIDVNGESRPYFDNIAWTGLIGNMGLPSAVPPLGLTAAGLPVGVQVVAPYLHDRTAVQVAGLISETVDGAGYRVPPGFWRLRWCWHHQATQVITLSETRGRWSTARDRRH